MGDRRSVTVSSLLSPRRTVMRTCEPTTSVPLSASLTLRRQFGNIRACTEWMVRDAPCKVQGRRQFALAWPVLRCGILAEILVCRAPGRVETAAWHASMHHFKRDERDACKRVWPHGLNLSNGRWHSSSYLFSSTSTPSTEMISSPCSKEPC